MFVPEDEAGEVREENSGVDAVPETETSEYHFNRDQYREQVYADAHYEPADESTVPPRYYEPPERPVKEPKPKKEKSGSGWGKLIAVTLIAALLGGMLGAALTGGALNKRMDAMEQNLAENSQALASAMEEQQSSQPLALPAAGEGMTAAQIYEQACRQVVGVTTEVTYTNFFGMTSSSAVSGSGFIISEDGYILTNYHVIESADQGRLPVTVMTYDGTKYDAAIVGTEEANDIAVLKIEASGLTPVTFGDSNSLSVGDAVYAVGNPLGELEFSMSTGHVSALDRVITTQESESINMFQIDAAVNPGNSGGPVYNRLGQVVGVVTAKYSSTGVEGLGFAIPVNDASSIADDLINKGYVTGKAYLGIWLDERYDAMYAEYYNMPLGAYIRAVDQGSCAEKAGLQAGDIITKLGGKEISSYTDLKAAVRNYSAGDSAEVEYYRAGEMLTLTVVFDEAKPASSVSAG